MPLRRRERGLPARLSTRPSARGCVEPAAPLPAPVLAGARVVRLARLRVGGLCPGGSCSSESPSFGGCATAEAYRFGCAPRPARPLRPPRFFGTQTQARGSEGHRGRRENLADLGPLGSDRYGGGEAGPGEGPCSGSPHAAAWGSRGLSLTKFYRVRRPRWGARCRGDESKPCPRGAPSLMRESVCEQAMTAAWKGVVGT